jgi:phage terminase large subunit-like protein
MRERGQVVPLRSVWASTGKTVRAEPVAALYEQGRVSHVGMHPDLEDVLTTWDGTGVSPHMLDALVWAVSDLSRGAGGGDVPVVGWQDTHAPQVAAWS